MPPLWRIIQIGRNFEISMRNCVLLLNAKRKRYVLSPEDLCSLKVWICGQFDTTIRMCVCMVWYRTLVGNELPSPHTEVLRSELIIISYLFYVFLFYSYHSSHFTHPISLIKIPSWIDCFLEQALTKKQPWPCLLLTKIPLPLGLPRVARTEGAWACRSVVWVAIVFIFRCVIYLRRMLLVSHQQYLDFSTVIATRRRTSNPSIVASPLALVTLWHSVPCSLTTFPRFLDFRVPFSPWTRPMRAFKKFSTAASFQRLVSCCFWAMSTTRGWRSAWLASTSVHLPPSPMASTRQAGFPLSLVLSMASITLIHVLPREQIVLWMKRMPALNWRGKFVFPPTFWRE